MALAIIPGAMLISFISARRVRPIYRTIRKDAENIDGRVGETFSGIRVVRAFGREIRELCDYMRGRHTDPAQGAVRASARADAVDLLGPAGLRRQRRHRVVRRVSEHHGRATVGDIMVVPVVHVPAPESGLEHREFVLGAAAVARGDGARLRHSGDAGRQTRPAGREAARRRSSTTSSSRTWSSSTATDRPVVRDFNVRVPGGSVVALVGRAAPARRPSPTWSRDFTIPRADASW